MNWSWIIIGFLTFFCFSAGCASLRTLQQIRPRIISSSGIRYYNPVFTSDGRQLIFFARDSTVSVCICATDGSEVRVIAQLPGWAGDLTPDGRFVILPSFRDQQNDIFRLDLGSAGIQNLTNSPADDNWSQLSPNGRYVAYVSSEEPVYDTTAFPGGYPGLKKHGKSFLMVMDIDGLHKEVVAENGWYPRWSPDSEHLAYDMAETTHKWSLDGTDEILGLKKEFSDWGCTDSSFFYYSHRRLGFLKRLWMYAWSSGIDEFHDLHIASMDKTRDYLLPGLTNYNALIARHEQTDRIALAVSPSLGDISYDGIILLDCSGEVIGDYRQHGPGFEYDGISWSPDGHAIAFSRHTRDWRADPALGGIFIMTVEGTDLRQVLQNAIVWQSN